MTKITVPGLIYSALSALAAWAVLYFDVGGAGADYVIAPVILGGVPVILKIFTVATTDPTPTPAAQARGMGEAVPAQSSKIRRFLLG